MKLSARLPGILMVSFMGVAGTGLASEDATTKNSKKEPAPATEQSPQSITLTEAEYNLIMINRTISNDHYDKGNALDSTKLLKDNISGRLSGLDPHSELMTPAEFAEFNERMSGKYAGVGIEISQGKKYISVIRPIEGSPADRAKLQPDDLITHVDGVSLEGADTRTAASKISGKPGTSVTLQIERNGVTLPPLTIVREEISQAAVTFSKIGTVGIIKLRAFSLDISQEFDKAVKALEALPEPPLSYALDLRDNPGGSLPGSAAVNDSMIDSRAVLITVRSRSKDTDRTFFAKPGDLMKGKPLAVLINENSASASELVAGTVQDLKRARIYGSQSFGKGSVQYVKEMETGWALKLTFAQYFTPLQAVQGKGIMPDVLYKPLTESKTVRRRESEQAHSLATTRPEEKLKDPEQTCSPVSEDVKTDGYHPMLVTHAKKLDLELMCVLDDLEAKPSGLTTKAPYTKPVPKPAP